MDPVLVIMAAGMGSRFGGLKQMTSVDDSDQVILDYSAYDALRSGFQKIVCVIKKEHEADFRSRIGDRIGRHCDLKYAFQDLADLPAGYAVPAGREKPWGTAHAVYSARNVIDGPFAVINADDFYGRGAFQALYDFLSSDGAGDTHCLVGYKLRNTLTENGTVARGICTVGEDGTLLSVTERTCIRGPVDRPAYSEDGGSTWISLDPNAPVSLNTWGFRQDFLDTIGKRLTYFMEDVMPQNPLKAEFFLPEVVNASLASGTTHVSVVHTDEVWHGVTYRNDLPALQESLSRMRSEGIYPDQLWT